MKKILLTIALVASCFQSSVAQEDLAQWINSQFDAGEALGRGTDASSARRDALCKIFDQTRAQADTSSLLYHLLTMDSTLVVDQRSAWAQAAASIPDLLVVKDTLNQDSVYWMHIKVVPEALSRFTTQLQQSCMMKGSECLISAHFNRDKGNLFGAACDYAQGISAVLPVLHCSLVSDILEDKDLGMTLFDEYMQVFDGVSIEALRDSLPVVAGEEIPVDLQFALKVNDMPLVHMPVQCWIDDGRVTCTPTSDEKGLARLHISKAPSKNAQRAGVIVHSNLFAMLEDNFARPILEKRFSSGFQQASTRLDIFNPTPTFAIQLDSLDYAHHDSLSVAMVRLGMIEAAAGEEPDLICSLEYQSERSASEKHGEYLLTKTSCQMKIKVNVHATGEELASYHFAPFDFLHPAFKQAGDVRVRTVELMMRQAVIELPEVLKKVHYDKRKVVYQSVK